MNKREYEKELAELKALQLQFQLEVTQKREELESRIAVLENTEIEEDSGTWRPEHDETYFHINTYGDILSSTWQNYFSDNEKYSIGNVFRTKEEAKFEVERLKVIQELKQFACEFRIREMNHFINYGYGEEGVFITFSNMIKGNEIYFSSKEQAQKAIDAVGEERIKKYYLGVKE